MNADLRVVAQYQENYNYYDGGEPYWKNKGGREFIFPKVSADDLMYNVPEADKAIQTILDRISNEAFRYKLIHWEFLFFPTKELSTEELMKEMGL
jgi:hypothetical protein